MVDIREARFRDHADEVGDLLAANWAETGYSFPLEANMEFYKRLEAMGFLLAIGAFEGNDIVGYSLASVTPHPFNPSVAMCNSSALFVHPSHRNSTIGARLMKETERLGRLRGARFMLWNTRTGSPLHNALIKHGYEPADSIMMKEL